MKSIESGKIPDGWTYKHYGNNTFFSENVAQNLGTDKYITRIEHYKFPLEVLGFSHSIILLHLNSGDRVVTEKN